MFRELIPKLADRYHLVAPDYPGFGHSAAPSRDKFAYTFDNLARITSRFTDQIGLSSYALYVMDYGAPVGFRIATARPEKITALIVQNGNAYEDGFASSSDLLRSYWKSGKKPERDAVRSLLTPQITKWQYTTGVSDETLLNPDTWTLDQALLDRPGNDEIQLDLLYDYRTNPPLYPQWQAYLRKHKPRTLVAWGKNDELFVQAGGAAYRRDLPNAEIHMLDTGHFALETHADEIATLIRQFLGRKAAAK
jgi:pimeloyl-ACP methyl ester carboxylesterase